LAPSSESVDGRGRQLDAAAAANGASVDIYWFYDVEDDTMQELGEEFGEDLESAKFPLEKMKANVR
jgi:SiaC family regulatory phosphoprotein